MRQGAEVHLLDWKIKSNCDILQVSASFTEAEGEGGALRSVQVHPCPWCSQRPVSTCPATPSSAQAEWEAPAPMAALFR